jgi:hypothetical protein
MTSRAVKQRLAQDVSLWQVDGFVSDEVASLLRKRYDTSGFGIGVLAKYLAVMGALIAGFGLLGFVGFVSDSLTFGAVESFFVAAALFTWGIKLAKDPLARYQQSSRAVLAIGLFALIGGGFAACVAANMELGPTLAVVGLIVVPVAILLAYVFRNSFLLVLAVLCLFHWLGSWHAMEGQSSYVLEIQDPVMMSVAAACAAAFGILQRRGKIPCPTGFDTVWLSVGLIYLNLALLILTVDSHRTALPWVCAAFAAGLLQIVLGATEKSAVLVAFGVTAVGLNLFTRYFEGFWDDLDKGLFFLIGGALLFAFGAGFEWFAKRLQGVRS